MYPSYAARPYLEPSYFGDIMGAIALCDHAVLFIIFYSATSSILWGWGDGIPPLPGRVFHSGVIAIAYPSALSADLFYLP